VRITKIDLPAYPEGHSWYFNPLAWQFLFVIAQQSATPNRMAATSCPRPLDDAARHRHLVVCTTLAASWTLHEIWHSIPALFVRQIDKTSLALPRLINFLAMALVVTRLLPADARAFRSRWAWPILLCGRNSLPVFCLGILLAVLGHFLLAETDGPLICSLSSM